MLLAIDIGNSNIVIGCIDEESVISHVFRMVTDILKTEDEYAVEMKSLLEFNGVDCGIFSGAIIASVVPPLSDVFKTAVYKLTGLTALAVGSGIKTGLNILIDNPAELGSDMAATAVGAAAKYPLPVIIVDMGTATKISVVKETAGFVGGAICPGVALSMDALSRGASLLPKVQIEAPKKCICGDTIGCMKSGAVFGAAAMVDGMLDRFETELGAAASVVATGGIAPRIVPYCRRKIICDDNLLLSGLKILYDKNKK
ncbi:MAG: type III pantothenate kinase [Oscillospiraceae bacterium]|jgi:type III pantothenate kinase|nr:type III pantothenate kinase [Oscillospiraceae bacterium]